MYTALSFFDTFLALLRPVLFTAAVFAAVLFALDWAVRTRRISQFGPLARFLRSYVDPLIAPIERRIVRAGGLPSSAPWWTLAALVVGSLILIWLLEFVRAQLGFLASGLGGARSFAQLLVYWTFGLLRFAILVRVISSWISISPYSIWVRWSFRLSEPILRPLRGIIPALGMIDITPIIAYFLLGFLQSALIAMLAA